MRGAVSGGMALGLDELGLAGAFDAAYGSSAGTLNAMWLVSGRRARRHPDVDRPAARRRADLAPPRRCCGGARWSTSQRLVEERYEQLSPGLFDAVLAGRTELHPIATDVETAEAVDLHAASSTTRRSLRLALRASAALPLLAGPPVAIDGRRYIDAGLSAAIPFRAALADGATHVLVLRSRRAGEAVTAPGRLSGALTGARAAARLAGARDGVPHARRARGAPTRRCSPTTTPTRRCSRRSSRSARRRTRRCRRRLERDLGVIRAGLEAGRAAAARRARIAVTLPGRRSERMRGMSRGAHRPRLGPVRAHARRGARSPACCRSPTPARTGPRSCPPGAAPASEEPL